MSDHIRAALQRLDPSNDNHWTADGAPRLETVKFLASDTTITRDVLNAAAPGFSRSSAVVQAAPQEPATSQALSTPAAAAGGRPAAPQAPARAQSTVVPPVPDGYTVDQLKEMLAEANKSYEQALAEHAAAGRAVQYAAAVVDRLTDALQKQQPESGFVHVVLAWQRTQAALREQRAARLEAVKNIDLSAILPQKSNLDKAFARKTGFGQTRPDFKKV